MLFMLSSVSVGQDVADRQADAFDLQLRPNVAWDLESNREGTAYCDVRCIADASGNLFLEAVAPSGLRSLTTDKFNQITDKHLERLDYSTRRISQATLNTHPIVAVRTASGRRAKVLVSGIGNAEGARSSDQPKSRQLQCRVVLFPRTSKRSVLPGDFTWDLESNQFGGRNPGIDVWLSHTDPENSVLRPVNDTGMVVLRREFGQLTREDLVGAAYHHRTIPLNKLTPGTVFAMKTLDGNFAKLRVIRYRSRHDVDFDEARHLSNEWLRAAFAEEDDPQFHLEMEWVLLK